MKPISLVVILLAVIGGVIASRHEFTEAARPDPHVETPTPPHGKELVLASATRETGEMVLARIAAECGDLLYDQARTAANPTQLLQQAAQHYRACLAHDSSNDPFFTEVRIRLAKIDQRLNPRETTKPPPPAPKVELPPEPLPLPKLLQETPRMVGPDGTPIKLNH